MYKSFLKLKYPVKESFRDSWRRYEEIYKLSIELAGERKVLPARHLSLKKSWNSLAYFWENYSKSAENSNLMFEAFYHICFRKFSEKVQCPIELRLILLIEDELLCFSFAFKAWLQTRFFQDAYCAITESFSKNVPGGKDYNGDLQLYLTHRVIKLVMMKNLSREEWTRLFFVASHVRQSMLWSIYNYVDEYEKAVHYLIPSSDLWYEEWSDRATLLTSIKQLYNVDFSNDIPGLYALINATKHKCDTIACIRFLHQTKVGSVELLQHLWGDSYAEKLQYGFLYLCRRYKATKWKKLSNRSRYEASNFKSHWIYIQLSAWCCDKTKVLDESFKKKIFDISMGR